MSAFLGPIHYWLYNKIRLQQAIVEKIYALGIDNGLSLEMECNHHFGAFENSPLEEMINLDKVNKETVLFEKEAEQKGIQLKYQKLVEELELKYK